VCTRGESEEGGVGALSATGLMYHCNVYFNGILGTKTLSKNSGFKW
jgi:hypothetical protein